VIRLLRIPHRQHVTDKIKHTTNAQAFYRCRAKIAKLPDVYTHTHALFRFLPFPSVQLRTTDVKKFCVFREFFVVRLPRDIRQWECSRSRLSFLSFLVKGSRQQRKAAENRCSSAPRITLTSHYDSSLFMHTFSFYG
jgi:hypothetical protein